MRFILAIIVLLVAGCVVGWSLATTRAMSDDDWNRYVLRRGQSIQRSMQFWKDAHGYCWGASIDQGGMAGGQLVLMIVPDPYCPR